MKKVYVTGADGMLGSSICRELLSQGYSVKALCYPARQTNTLAGLPLEIVLGDISDKDFLLESMKGCDHVIHVAALMTLWPRRSPRMSFVNIEGTKNVMDAVEALNIQRMIHIGTANSFANGTKEEPGTENSPFNSGNFGLDYIDSKYIAQQMLINRFKGNGFPVIIINPTYMIGPFDSGPSSGQMLIAIYNDSLKFYCDGGKNFVCSVDVAKAAVNAITLGVTGECYIAGNENLDYREFFAKASKYFNKKFTMKMVPKTIVLTAGFLSSALARITRKPPKLSYAMALLAKEKQFYSPEKARQVLKMPQTPIEVGIEQCMDWFK